MYFQQVELFLKEEMKVSGFFFPNLLLMFSQEYICKCFSPFRAVFLSLLCALLTLLLLESKARRLVPVNL